MSARDRLRRRAAASSRVSSRAAVSSSGERPVQRPSGGWGRHHLASALSNDRCFQVMTVDGLHWIDPFTKQRVAAAFDWKDAALAWLVENKPWETQPEVLHIGELLKVRWMLMIRERLGQEPRLRHFLPDGRWLNPLSGKWVGGIHLKKGQVGRETLAGMALAMAKAEHRSGTANLKDEYDLKAVYDRAKSEFAAEKEPVVIDGGGGSSSGNEPPSDFVQGSMRIGGRKESQRIAPVGRPSESTVRARSKTPVEEDVITPRMLDEMFQVGYRVIEELGAGGMGAVYRAEQLSLEREVALKLRLPGNQDFPKFVERFLNEAKSAAKIAHPNVVTMFDVGRTQSLVYMAMELLGGGDVDMAVEREGRLPEQQALRWTCDALMGLGAIHSHGIIHRDIKTSNLFLTSDGMVKIGDLGIARDPERDLKITKTNAVLGTPAFMPPEQSVPGGKLDNRSDIYSIGVTLYHMLSGYLPFDDVNPLVILRKIITEPVPSVRTVAPGVRGETAAFIQWLMDKDPDRRPPDVQAALNAVEGLIT